MPRPETSETIHVPHVEIPAHIWEDIEFGTRTALAERTAAKALQAIFQRNGVHDRRTEQSLGVYDLLGQTTNAAQSEYAVNLERQIQTSIERRTRAMTTEERQRVAMVLPSLVGALVLDERYVDKAYDQSLPESVDIALDWFMHPNIIDQTHIRVGFGGEEVTNSRAPAYIVPALETQRRVRDTFTRYGNWAIHQEMVNRIQGSTPHVADHRETIARLNTAIAQQLASYSPEQSAKTPSELMEEIYNMTAEHKIPAQHKREVLLATWYAVFGEPLDIEELERRYHFTNKVPKLVVFNAANAAIEVDGMDRERVTGARGTTQALIREFVNSFYPEMGDSVVFQNDKPWDNHDYYTQMMVMFSRYLTSKRSNIGGVWKNLDRFGDHHQRAGKKGRVIDGMTPAETYGSLHPFFFQDPLRTNNPAELLPDPGIMEHVDNPRHVIFHQGPPEIQFGALRKVWAQDAGAKGFVDWLTQRRDSADELKSAAQEIFNESVAVSADKFASNAKRMVSKAPRKVRSLLISMIQAVEHDADPLAAWEQQITEIHLFDAAFSTPLIEQLNARRTAIGKRNDSLQVAVARNDGSAAQLISDDTGKIILQQTRRSLELTVSIGTIPVYYPLEGVDQEVDALSPNPTLSHYENHLARVAAKTKRIRGSIQHVTDNLILPSQELANGDEPQVDISQHPDLPAIVEMYAHVEAREQAIADEGRKATDSELADMVAFLHVKVATIAEKAPTLIGQLFHHAHAEILRDRAVAESKARAVLHDFNLLLQAIDADPHVAEQKYGELLDRIKQGMAAHAQEHAVAYL